MGRDGGQSEESDCSDGASRIGVDVLARNLLSRCTSSPASGQSYSKPVLVKGNEIDALICFIHHIWSCGVTTKSSLYRATGSRTGASQASCLSPAQRQCLKT